MQHTAYVTRRNDESKDGSSIDFPEVMSSRT